jgi:DNA-binding SARP family transcriptional activator/predicted ATPase
MLKVKLLGAPQLIRDDTPITGFITRKAEALFFYLVVTQRMHMRDALATLFWADDDQQRARKNLRDITSNLRELLGDYLLITRSTIAFDSSRPYWLDTERFQTHLQQATPALAIEETLRAIDLYRGEFLEGFHVRGAPNFEEWMLFEREHLHKAYIQGQYTLATRYLDHQDYHAAVLVTQRLLAIEPWQERAHRQLMVALAGSGRINEALAQYTICCRILADELGLEPMAETTALYHQIRSGAYDKVTSDKVTGDKMTGDKVITDYRIIQSSFQDKPTHPVTHPPSHLVTRTPHNLPRQLTPFFVRTVEIAAVCAKLQQPDCFWLTLTGVGGVGKTRLALKIGETLLPYFRDGVWFVSLLDIVPGKTLEEQLVAAIGKALHLSFTGAESLKPQLLTYLREKQLLLILDNFEHLNSEEWEERNQPLHGQPASPRSAADIVYQLLQATRQLKVLITSRHRLDYQAEHLFTLDGLPLPEVEEVDALVTGQLGLTQLLQYDSVALFAQRAAQSSSVFALNAETATAIVQICRLLEGLPLGIELAATLIQRYSCPQIVRLLENHYAILATTFHDLPARHRSIEATLAYSWQLLGPDDALLLAQCAIFRNSFTHAAATAITGATPAQLQRLEDQLLLHPLGAQRYTMHRLMRQYALQQLQTTPVTEQVVHERHCRYFVHFLKAIIAERVPLDAQAFNAIQEEMGNIYSSWEWAVEQGHFTLLHQLLPPLTRIWTLAGSHREIAAILLQAVIALKERFAVQLADNVEVQQLLAQLLLEQAYFYNTTARIEEAKTVIEEALRLAHRLGDLTLTTIAYQRLGDAAWAQGDYQQHRLAYEQALHLAQTIGRPQSEVHSLSNLGMNHDMRSEYSRAIHYYQAALVLTRANGDRATENVIYNNLGVSSALLGDYTEALHYYQETLQISRELGDQEGSGFANLNLGLLHNSLGEWQQARYYGERALKIFRMIDNHRLEARTLAQLSITLHQTGETAQAASHAQQALQIARSGGYQAVQAEALTVWGQLFLERCQPAKAVTLLREAYTLWQSLGRPRPPWRFKAAWLIAYGCSMRWALQCNWLRKSYCACPRLRRMKRCRPKGSCWPVFRFCNSRTTHGPYRFYNELMLRSPPKRPKFRKQHCVTLFSKRSKPIVNC